jgi:hypothetical protein
MPRRRPPTFGKVHPLRRSRPPRYDFARVVLPVAFPRNEDFAGLPLQPVVGTITLPDTRRLHIILIGRDDLGRSRPLYNVQFQPEKRGIIDVTADPNDPTACYVRPIQTGTVILQATATPTPGVAPAQLVLDITIIVVPGLAVTIKATYSIDGGPELPVGPALITIPLNKTAVVTMTAYDDFEHGQEVPVTDITWSPEFETNWHTTPHADPHKINIIPDSIGGGAAIQAHCDADVSGEVIPLSGAWTVNIIDTAATELEALYSMEHP